MRKDRTEEELKLASDHLFYEIWMLNSLANGMSSGVLGEGPVNNAVLEAFVIHVRNIIHFLYADKPKSDHVIAADYFNSPTDWEAIRPKKTELMKISEIRAHKEVAHLSYDRAKVTPETKPWTFVDLANEITSAFNVFLSNINIEVLGDRWQGNILSEE